MRKCIALQLTEKEQIEIGEVSVFVQKKKNNRKIYILADASIKITRKPVVDFKVNREKTKT